AGAAGLTGDSAALGFKPVAFEPGEHKLSGAGLAHLDALGRELKGHPAVELQVCGRAVSADRIRIEQRRSESADGRPPLSDQGTFEAANVDLLLQNLARERASTVRRYLEENKGITQERLIECEAKVESVPGRLPRVDLPVRVETGPNATRSKEPPG
ncbi:MAG: hypothetical protein OEN48_18520, partial [Betaproteobacteria bacterium]|nr:hypothetical protein [Betaproteobacteria bacterium]